MDMIKRIQCGIVNCYFIGDEEGGVLVDACNAEDGEAVLKAVGGAQVRLIILTHGHSDHIGAAAFLRERTGAPIAMAAEDVALITDPGARRLYGHTALGRVLASASVSTMEAAKTPVFSPDLLVADKEELSRFGISARVIALPGHTAGSIGVLTEDNEIIAGDAAFNMLRPTGARIYEDRAKMEQSVARMKELGVKLIYVGHGSPISPDDL